MYFFIFYYNNYIFNRLGFITDFAMVFDKVNHFFYHKHFNNIGISMLFWITYLI